MNLVKKLFRGDVAIWILFTFLCALSVVEVYSASSTLAYKQTYFWMPIWRHMLIMLGGVACMIGLVHVEYTKIVKLLVFYCFPGSLLLLLLAPFIGEEVNGANRWVFGLQPSELAKITTITFVAWMLSKRDRFTEDQLFKYILMGVMISFLLIFPENFSTACMLFVVCYLLMLIGGLPMKKMLVLAASLLAALVLFVTLLFTVPEPVLKYIPRALTWKNRIVEHVENREAEKSMEEMKDTASFQITDDNYQVAQAKIAIARGGVVGQMPGYSKQRDFLPQAYSDFIYAIILEEWGILGGTVVLLAYIVLLIRVGIIARRCDKLLPKFVVLGCALILGVQALANMAVAVNLIPVTGQPMPLVSRGGTSTIISCLYVGIILSVSRFAAGMGDQEEDVMDSVSEKELEIKTDTEKREVENETI